MGYPFDRDQIRHDVRALLADKFSTFNSHELSAALMELVSEIEAGPDWRSVKPPLHTYRFTARFELPFYSRDQGVSTVMHHLNLLGLADMTLEIKDLGVSVILGDSRP